MRYHDVTHVNLNVRDLVAAEALYTALFDMAVVWREPVPDELSVDAPRAAIESAGVTPTLAFLRRDAFRLALTEHPDLGEPAEVGPSLLDHVGLQVSEDELRAVGARARERGCTIVAERAGELLVLVDPLGARWELDTRSYDDPAAIAEAARRRRAGR